MSLIEEVKEVTPYVWTNDTIRIHYEVRESFTTSAQDR